MHIRRREQRTIFDAVLVNLIADPEELTMERNSRASTSCWMTGSWWRSSIGHWASATPTVERQGAQRRRRKWFCECSSSST
jgi:hypothetical protein